MDYIAASRTEDRVAFEQPSRILTGALNFDLLISKIDNRYQAQVIDAPGGEATVLFDLPYPLETIINLAQPHGRLRHIGSLLYDTIFQGEVRSVYVASQREADAHHSALRLRMRFGDDAAELATVPWEVLFDPEQRKFLALSESRPVLRYLSLPRPRPTLAIQPPLSILTVLANPREQPRLDVEQEWDAVCSALKPLIDDHKVVLDRLEQPTFTALSERLLRDRIHVLHFLGHGIFATDRGEGLLLFEDSSGYSDFIAAADLALLLSNHASLRLVYLNACEGAIADQGNVFTGVAQTLVQQGLPAAVAMQDEITDAAAVETSRVFYTALAGGHPVDAALTYARLALATSGSGEWITPVLFSRSPDNRLFDVDDLLPTPACPYPGMRTFTEAQADLFYGRDEEIEDAVQHLAVNQFLTVVGPSGCGKSSLVHAGVIPALRHSHRFGDGAWDVHIMRPSDVRIEDGKAAPLLALKQSLGKSPDDLRSIRLSQPTLLFIDQFEETFALCDPDERDMFLHVLHGLIGCPDLYVLLTVRADFFTDLMSAGDLWDDIKENRLEIAPLGSDDLWSAIVKPAARTGVTVEDALAVALIDDASDQRGPLPLVQETLVLLWEKVEKLELKRDAYLSLTRGRRSGLQVAIDRLADKVCNDLSPDGKRIARRIFLRLVQFGQGRADTRRQQTVEELKAIDDDPDTFRETLATLTQSRLLTMSGEERHENNGDATRQVDISHEALLAGWQKLRAWVTEYRESEQLRRRLEEKAKNWAKERSRSALLVDIEYRQATTWLDSAHSAEMGYSEQLIELVQASRNAQNRRRAKWIGVLSLILILLVAIIAVQEIYAKQLGVAEQSALANESEALAALSEGRLDVDPVSAIYMALQGLPGETSDTANRPYVPEAEYALMRALQASMERDYLKVTDHELDAAQVAVDNMQIIVGADQLYAVDSKPSLIVTDILSPRGEGKIGCVAWRPQAEAYVYCHGSSLWLQSSSLVDPESIKRFGDSRRTIEGVGWSPDGRWLTAWDNAGWFTLWRMFTDLPVVVVNERLSDANRIIEVAWSADGEYLATVAADGMLRVWHIDGGRPTQNVEVKFCNAEEGSTCSAAGVRFAQRDSNEELIVTWAQDGNVRFWSLTGDMVRAVQPIDADREGQLNGIEVRSDGQQIAVFALRGTFYLLSTSEPDVMERFEGHSKSVGSILWNKNGNEFRYLASCSADGTARVWDTTTDRELMALWGHGPGVGRSTTGRADVHCLQWFDDGTLLTSGEDGTLRVWQIFDDLGHPVCVGRDDRGDLRCRMLGRQVANFGGPLESVRWHDNQTILAVDANGGAQRLRLAPEAKQTLTETVVSGGRHALWDPEGRRVFTFSDGDAKSRIWDADTSRLVRELDSGSIKDAWWLEAGILYTDDADQAFMVDPDSGAVLRFEGKFPDVCDAQSHATRLAVAHKDGRLSLWDMRDGRQIPGSHEQGAMPFVTYKNCNVQWTRDGSALLSAGSALAAGLQRFALWNAEPFTMTWSTKFDGQASDRNQILFSPDERFVAAAIDRSLYILNRDTGDVLDEKLIHESPILGLEWVDGVNWDCKGERPLLLSWAEDGTTSLWYWHPQGAELTEIQRVADDLAMGDSTATRSIKTWASLSPDGTQLMTAGHNGVLRVWPACLRDSKATVALAEEHLSH